jgi:hypothetical protein
MNNHPLNNIKQAAEQIRLSERERAVMRTNLIAVMGRSGAGAAERAHAARTPYFFFASPMLLGRAMSLAALMIIVLGGTTTYAAQGALPGGVLYPVKIYVNEGVAGALAVSDQAKLSYHTGVAQERLKEAEALAAEGKLDATTTAQLETNFNDHLAQADTIAANLEEQDPASGIEAKVTLDSSIAAHGSILARIGDQSDDEQTKENSQAIAAHVRARGSGGVVAVALKAAAAEPPMMQTMSLQVNAQAAPDASSSSGAEGGEGAHVAAKAAFAPSASITAATTSSSQDQKKIALQLQKKASAELSDTRDTFNYSKSGLDASTTLKVKAQLADLDRRMKAGLAQIKDDQYEAARATLTGVLQDSIELNAFIEASKTYKRDLVRAWPGAEDGASDADKRFDGQPQNAGASNPATAVGTTSTSSEQGDGKGKNNGGEGPDDAGLHLEIRL